MGVASRSSHLPPLPCIPSWPVPPCPAHLLLGTAGLLWKGQLTAAVSHVSDQPRNLLTVVGKGRGQGLQETPGQECPRGCPKRRFWEGKRVGIVQDLLLGDNSLVSTDIVHDVGGDSAEVNGQEIPVIFGEGSLLGEAFVAFRAGRVPAAGVGVGLYSQFSLTVAIEGLLPLRQKEGSQKPGLFSPSPLTLHFPCCPHHRERDSPPQCQREGQRARGQGGSCGV